MIPCLIPCSENLADKLRQGMTPQYLEAMTQISQDPEKLAEYYAKVREANKIYKSPAVLSLAKKVVDAYHRTPQLERLLDPTFPTPEAREQEFTLLLEMSDRAGVREEADRLGLLNKDEYAHPYNKIPPISRTAQFLAIIAQIEYSQP